MILLSSRLIKHCLLLPKLTSKGTYLKFSKAKKKRLGDSIFTNSFVLAVGKKNNCLILKLFKVQKGARQ